MKRIRLALSIISGRRNAAGLSTEEMETLGYDTYKFSYYGAPDENEVKERAEDAVYFALEELCQRGSEATI